MTPLLIDNVDWLTAPVAVGEEETDDNEGWTGTKIRCTDGSYQIVPLALDLVRIVFAFATYEKAGS